MESRYYPPDSRRIKRVKLADVPKRTRTMAAERVCREETDAYERLRIKMIAEDPGDACGWIAA